MTKNNPFLASVSFLTSIGRAGEVTDKAVPYFGVTGALVGVVVGLTWLAAEHLVTPLVAGTLVVIVDIMLTYGIHYDGFADCGDGLFAHLSRQRRLEAMRQPQLGAFGVLALILLVLLRIGVFEGLRPNLLAVIAIFALSRSLMALLLATSHYARPNGGMASSFENSMLSIGDRAVWTVSVVIAIGVLIYAVGLPRAMVSLLVGVAIWGVYTRRGLKLLGGYTGDLIGAGGVLFETATLLAILMARSI